MELVWWRITASFINYQDQRFPVVLFQVCTDWSKDFSPLLLILGRPSYEPPSVLCFELGARCTLQDESVSQGWPLTRSSRVVLGCPFTFLMIIDSLWGENLQGARQMELDSHFEFLPFSIIAFLPSCWLIVLFILPASCGSSFVPVVLSLIECVDRFLLYRSRVQPCAIKCRRTNKHDRESQKSCWLLDNPILVPCNKIQL